MIVPILGIIFSLITGVAGVVLIWKAMKNYSEAKRINLLADYMKNQKREESYTDEVEKGIWRGVLAGALGGGIMAILMYKLAGLLANASTGTKISSLSGITATRANYAFFGGGAIAKGGFGIAGGKLVLTGIIICPTVTVIGAIIYAMSKGALKRAEMR